MARQMTTTTTTLVLPDGTEVQTTITVRHPDPQRQCPGLARCDAIETTGKLVRLDDYRRAS